MVIIFLVRALLASKQSFEVQDAQSKRSLGPVQSNLADVQANLADTYLFSQFIFRNSINHPSTINYDTLQDFRNQNILRIPGKIGRWEFSCIKFRDWAAQLHITEMASLWAK